MTDAGDVAANTFWAALATGEPRLQYDPEAGRHLFPPRPAGLFPPGGLEWRPIARTGTLLAATVVRTPPAGFVLSPPYRVGLVRLDAGPRMFGVVEAEAREAAPPPLGSRVELVGGAADGAPPLRFRLLLADPAGAPG